jgi:hypothetical protein
MEPSKLIAHLSIYLSIYIYTRYSSPSVIDLLVHSTSLHATVHATGPRYSMLFRERTTALATMTYPFFTLALGYFFRFRQPLLRFRRLLQ